MLKVYFSKKIQFFIYSYSSPFLSSDRKSKKRSVTRKINDFTLIVTNGGISIFIISEQVSVTTTDAGEYTGALQRRRFVQPVKLQVRGVGCACRCVNVVLVGLDVEALAARQRGLVRSFGLRRHLKSAVRVNLGRRRAHRVLDRYVNHATVLSGFAGCAVSTERLVSSAGLRRCLHACRRVSVRTAAVGVQISRQRLRRAELFLPFVIAGQSAGGFAKPAERAGGDAETRSFPKQMTPKKKKKTIVRMFSRRFACDDDRMYLMYEFSLDFSHASFSCSPHPKLKRPSRFAEMRLKKIPKKRPDLDV